MNAFKLKSSRSIFWSPTVLAVLLATCISSCSQEEASPSHEEIVATEFEAILDLHDQTCGGVASFEKTDYLSYKLTCTSGEVYRINVSHEGQVKVAPHVP